MADKTLKTRIVSKHASYTAWADSTLVLLAGEIALASIETTQPDGQGGKITVPTYLMKVGDGKKTFIDSDPNENLKSMRNPPSPTIHLGYNSTAEGESGVFTLERKLCHT